MNKTDKTALGGGSYQAPEVKVTELETEGVLCASFGDGNGRAINEGWGYDDDLWS